MTKPELRLVTSTTQTQVNTKGYRWHAIAWIFGQIEHLRQNFVGCMISCTIMHVLFHICEWAVG